MNSLPSPKSRTSIEPLESRIAPAVALVDLGAVDGTNGFKINGVATDDFAGFSVSAAGDVNGDGRPDFLIGADGADPGGRTTAGAVYVVFGRATAFPASFDLSTLNGTNGFAITGETVGDFAGLSVAAAGDLNGDRLGDLIIGAPTNDPGRAGSAYIVYGRRAGAATLDLSSATVTQITGEAAGDAFGTSVAAAGDVNRDGRPDLIIGAPGAAGFTGASYVIFGRGRSFGPALAVSTLNGLTGFKMAGEATDDQFGGSVSGAGDVNGDGFADLIVGAAGAGANDAGAAYVIYGRSRFAGALAPTSLTGPTGFKIVGELATDGLGSSVSGAGDVNGDRLADLVIGASTADRNAQASSGSAYVVFGRRTSFGPTLDLATLTGANGFEIPGIAVGSELGASVSRAGDLNRDGFADLLIGAASSDPSLRADAGSAYAIFGKRDGFTANLDLAALNGINGFRINGAVAGDTAGSSVSAAGDVNRDGFADLLVGAPRLEGAAGPGAAYVIYGTALPVRISADGRSAVLTDTDGDTIVVRVNKGRLGQDDFTLGANDRGLVSLNLSDDGTEFQGASISIGAVIPRGGTGDGLANVGFINATGLDLGNVTVRGDLDRIDSGDANLSTTGLNALSVRSLAQGATIVGRFGAFAASGNVAGVVDVNGSIGSVSIRGNLDGSAGGTLAGLLRAAGSIGNVAVTGDILGGADFSGVVAGGRLGGVSVGDDLTSANPAKPVLIYGDGKPLPANPLTPVLAIAGLSVRGDVENARILADTTVANSQLNSNAAIGNVVVRGNWTDSLLQSTGNIGNVTIVGNLTGTNTLGLFAGRRMGVLTVFGNVSSDNSGTPLLIGAAGDNAGGVLAAKTAAGNLAFAGITIGRTGDAVVSSVTNTWFLAGYGRIIGGFGPVNADASIGIVVVEGSFNASNLVAGVTDFTSLPTSGDGFGRNDVLIDAFDSPSLTARIAAVVIRGAVTDGGIGGSHFGITAQQIGVAVISGARLPLTTGFDDLPLGTTGDIRLVEVAPII